MKIIQPGQINEVPADWWVDKRLTCSSCRAVFELEAGDDVQASAEQRLGGSRSVTAICPTCEGPVTHREGGLLSSVVTWTPNPAPPFFGPIGSDPSLVVTGSITATAGGDITT